MSCRPGKSHKWTVISSKRGYVNCYWCGDSKPGKSEFWGCGVITIALVGIAGAVGTIVNNLPLKR